MDNHNFRPFGWRDKIGYLLGDLGGDFTFVFSTTILMKFYTDVMGVSALAVGYVLMAARIVDAFTDIAMGRIADRTPAGPKGKYRPWLLRMSIPTAAASFLIYQSNLAGLPVWLKILYLAMTYLLWGAVCYTGMNIPYGSMASAISPHPDDRQSLSTWRTMGGMFAGVVIGVTLPLVVFTTDARGNSVLVGSRVTAAAGVFSLLAAACSLGAYALLTERVQYAAGDRPPQQSLGQMFRGAASNRSLLSLIAASMVMLVAQLTMQNMAAYVYPNFYRAPEAQSVSTICMLVGMSVAAALAKPLVQKFGKAEVSAVATALAGLVNLVLYWVRPESVWVYLLFQLAAWLGLGVFSMVNWALVTDVIDDAQLRTGVREDGGIYALYSWARKLGQAASAGLTGWLLTAIGYDTDTAFLPQVTERIFNISVLVPMLGFLTLAGILWFWYPLHKRKVEENVRRLRDM